MSDSPHSELDLHAQQARERLLATLDVLDHRARNLVQTATNNTRATMVGLAGAMALSVALVVAERASRRLMHRGSGSYKPSLVGDAFRVGAVAVMFVGLSRWAKRAAHSHGAHRAAPPQLRHNASTEAAASSIDNRAAQGQPGMSHALEVPDTTSHDPGRFDHD